MKNQEVIPTFKICIIGDGGCGKTTWINKLLSGNFNSNYVATLGVKVDSLQIRNYDAQADIPFMHNINASNYKIINIWDCAGQEKFAGLQDNYYVGASAAIFAIDLTNANPFRGLSDKIAVFKNKCPYSPYIILGLKRDSRHEANSRLHAYLDPNIVYVECSSRQDTQDELKRQFSSLLFHK